MEWLWPWGFVALAPVAAAALWALRRPLHQAAPVGSLRLWLKTLDALGPSAAKPTRRASAAWVALLAGAAAGALALSRPVWHAQSPARRIAVAVWCGAELGDDGAKALRQSAEALLTRLDPRDRVRLVLPTIMGRASDWLTPADAAARARGLQPLPVRAAALDLPEAEGAAHVYRFAPATFALPDAPAATTIALPARPGAVTLDAVGVAPAATGKVQVFAAVRNHTDQTRRGEMIVRRDGQDPIRLRYDVPARGRQSLLAEVPAGGGYYSAELVGAAGVGATAYAVRRSAAEKTVALVGRDNPLIRRFVDVHPSLRAVADPAGSDAVIATAQAAPAGQPALLIDPPTPPPGWRASKAYAALALRDADVQADHPILAGVDLAGVAIRRSASWTTDGAPAQQRLVAVGADALALAADSPRRVYLAFDLTGDNTPLVLSKSFVILLANVAKYLLPDLGSQTTYGCATALELAGRPDLTRLDAPAGTLAAALPAPGVYRDPAGGLHAVSVLGLRSAEADADPTGRAAAVALPAPRPVGRTMALWPLLAAASVVFSLLGWALRLR